MGCNDKVVEKTEISEERRAEILAVRDQARRDAIEKLREAGLIIKVQASEHVVHVIADRVEWSSVDGKLTYKIDGVDISNMVHGLQSRVVQKDFPVDTLILKSKPVFIPKKKAG